MRSVSKVLSSNLRLNGVQARPMQSMQPFPSMMSNQSTQNLFLQQFSYATRQEHSVKKEKKARTPKAEKGAKSFKTSKTSKTSKTRTEGAKTEAKKENKAKKATVKKEKTFMKTLKRSDLKLLEKYPDPHKPQHPLSAYNLFVKDQVSVASGVKFADAAKMWKNTSELDKQEYNEMAKQEKESYLSKKSQYKLIEDDTVAQWLQTIKQLKEEMPPRSGYLGFIKENTYMYKQGVNAAQVTKELSQKWKSMSEQQRRQYNDQYSNLYQLWKAKVQSYYE